MTSIFLKFVFAFVFQYPNDVPAITIKNPRGLGEDELAKLVCPLFSIRVILAR